MQLKKKKKKLRDYWMDMYAYENIRNWCMLKHLYITSHEFLNQVYVKKKKSQNYFFKIL